MKKAHRGFIYTSEVTEDGVFTCDGCIFLGKQPECKDAPNCEDIIYIKVEKEVKNG